MNFTIKKSHQNLTEEKIRLAELELGVTIPDEYRGFLLQHNGGYPDPSDFPFVGEDGSARTGTVDSFLGIDIPEETFTLKYTMETFQDRIPPGFFPVAREAGGNLICLETRGKDEGKAYFWDHENEADDGDPPSSSNTYEIASNFNEFLGMIV